MVFLPRRSGHWRRRKQLLVRTPNSIWVQSLPNREKAWSWRMGQVKIAGGIPWDLSFLPSRRSHWLTLAHRLKPWEELSNHKELSGTGKEWQGFSPGWGRIEVEGKGKTTAATTKEWFLAVKTEGEKERERQHPQKEGNATRGVKSSLCGCSRPQRVCPALFHAVSMLLYKSLLCSLPFGEEPDGEMLYTHQLATCTNKGCDIWGNEEHESKTRWTEQLTPEQTA